MVNQAFLQLFELERPENITALKEVAPELPEWLLGLEHNTESFRKLQLKGTPFHLIFLASQMKILGRMVTLVSVRDISREIEQNELEAWQKLMRVLRHEILNSVTPIRLLAGSISANLSTEMNEEEVSDLKNGLETIHRRASGLSSFMDAYSNLYRVPELEFTECSAGKILQRIALIYKDECDKMGIQISIKFKEDGQSIKLDPRLIEQVLMNLIKNAIEALSETKNPLLTLSARQEKGKSILIISDNGRGIPDDQLDHIFIPFYSTREGGSGVGLSFAQHVMRLHGGHIHVTSLPGEGSEFQVIFPKA